MKEERKNCTKNIKLNSNKNEKRVALHGFDQKNAEKTKGPLFEGCEMRALQWVEATSDPG